MKRKRLNPIGRKGRLNQRANRLLKAECVRLGITRCELRYEGCTGTEFLTHAHAKKRRKLTIQELNEVAICCCVNCHNRIEFLPSDQMESIVLETLARRADRFVEAAF